MSAEQYAQDAGVPEGIDMGIAYEMVVKARRFYKEGVKQNERMTLLELVVIRDDDSDEVLGRVAADLNGGFVVSDDEHKEQWHIDVREIWESYLTMREGLAEEDKT